MKIPDNLEPWKNPMEQDAESRQILRNLESEVCLEDDVEEEFWKRLANEPVPTNSSEARDSALKATRVDPALTFKRREIPTHRFALLVRYGMPHKLPQFFPGLDLTSHGLTPDKLRVASEDELEALVEEANISPEMGLGDMTWVAESSAEIDTAKLQPVNLMNRVGLPWLVARLEQDERPCVEFRYDRADLPTATTLHVPSSLDGIDFAPFRPNSDCSAPSGMTEPINSAAGPGFPEAIHGACKVAKFAISLIVP